jgi:hypothetical protein
MARARQLGLYLYTVRFVIAEAECERPFVQLSKHSFIWLFTDFYMKLQN